MGSGEHLLLTFMSIDREHDVLGFDVPVLAAEFVHAVCKACERLLADLLSLDDHYAADPFVRHFSGQLAALARRRKVTLSRSSTGHDGEMAGATSRIGDGRELTFSYEMSLTPGFVGYHGEPTFDWHALLLPGQILAETDGHHIALGGRFPIFTVVSILRRVREVLNHTEAGRARFACRGRLPGLMLHVDCNDGLTRLEIGPEPALVVDTTLDAAIDVLLSLSRLIIDDIHRQNSDIKLNVRFDDIDNDVRELQAWFEDVRRENKYFERPEAYVHSHAGLRPHEVDPQEPSFGWPLKDVRAVYPSRKWVWAQSSIHFSAVNVVDDMVLVPSLHGLVALDASTGREIWAIEQLDNTKLASFTVAGPYVVLANERGQRALVDRVTGRMSTSSAASSPILISAAHFATQDLVVVADYRSNLMGIRPDGETAWTYERGQGTAVGAAFPGPVVSTLSQPGVLSAFDPLKGDVLWRVRLGAAGHMGPFEHEGRLTP
ncbi:MAG: PQQ-binding-like beta-propeller repeat protein [bacterium]